MTTAATLILELALTRIFSVVFYYHFAFLAISIALFGLGAGGVLSYRVRANGRPLFAVLGAVSLGNALVVAASLWLILRLAGEQFSGVRGFVSLGVVYLSAALPFVGSGAVLSLVIAETVERVDRVYFYDLAGGAVGCLLFIPFLNLTGGPGAVLSAAVLFAAASAVWFGLAGSVARRAVCVGLALVLVGLILYNKSTRVIDVTAAKGSLLSDEIFVAWNSFSRIAVKKNADGSGLTVAIDADATTAIPAFDLDHPAAGDSAALKRHGPGFPYLIRPGAKALVLGAGGGWDVACAIAGGSRDVTGVEINPIIADTVMRKRFRKESRDLYFRPEVRIFVEDGRSFVRRTSERYQVIQATLVDTWASTAAGAFALSENNLYTVEAFSDYFRRLEPGGILAFTRWGFDPPRESLRVLALAREALGAAGRNDFARHVIVAREKVERRKSPGATDTVIVSRDPLDGATVERAVREADAGGFDLLYWPGCRRENDFAAFVEARDPGAFYRSYRFDIRPVSDDRPFFFYTVQLREIWRFLSATSHDAADYQVNLAVPTLFSLLLVSVVATLVILAAPPLFHGGHVRPAPGLSKFLVYFACLGAGYILVQASLVQRLVLLLGHPTYALTVVLFTMMLASGLGSYFSRRLTGAWRHAAAASAAVALLVALLAAVIQPAMGAAATWPLGLRLGLAVALVGPAAFFMGIPFPSGVGRLARLHPEAVRWAWSVNAAASVLGSSVSIVLALYAGLRSTLLAGALLYVLAAMLLRRGDDAA
jgi:SAM-dependent methyltransferase